MGNKVRDTVRPMLIPRTLKAAFALLLTLFFVPFAVGCGGSQAQVKTADHIVPGTMPPGGEWPGVYYDQLYGFLHLTEMNGAVQGAWETTAGDKWGELYGEVKGDVLKFSWTEHKKGVVGPTAKSEGKGYFRYTAGKSGEAQELKGEWGLGENAVGHTWNCLKQLNMEPDPKSVRPDEMESRVGAVGFDGAKGDSEVGTTEEEKKEEGKPKEEGASDDPL